ncbi:MAG TPA: archease [Nitrosopumilaceae archaeon]|jgi:SHS2 domain-containing protein
MSYKLLEHATDAFIEVTASNLKEAFIQAGNSVVETTIDRSSVKENEKKKISVTGKEIRYLLFDWLEEIIYQLITEGFAIHRFELDIKKNKEYKLEATAFGEPIDLQKHNFKVEIKAPTFHLMEISEGKEVKMRFLLDL